VVEREIEDAKKAGGVAGFDGTGQRGTQDIEQDDQAPDF